MPKLSDVSSPYGAPMGRPSYRDDTAADFAAPVRFSLCRIRVNSGGYDSGGAYWGLGAPLYYAAASRDDTGALIADIYVRGRTRDAAKAAVRERYPTATFYR